MRAFSIILTFFISLFLISANAQEQTESEPLDTLSSNLNIDSLIVDSIRRAFILNHRPLTDAELNPSFLIRSRSVYGEYAPAVFKNQTWYSLAASSLKFYISKKDRADSEWVFYSFLVLLFFPGIVNKYNPAYIRNVFRVYFNDGFIYRQAKDQMGQSPYAAFMFNVLFLLSGCLYLFFGKVYYYNVDVDQWRFMLFLLLALLTVYSLKFIFLSFFSWLFAGKEVFDHYMFVVFLNNKILGVFLLFVSTLMAFSSEAVVNELFGFSLYVVLLFFAVRAVRGYRIFSKQFRIGWPGFLLGFFALEILPTLVALQFFSKSLSLIFSSGF